MAVTAKRADKLTLSPYLYVTAAILLVACYVALVDVGIVPNNNVLQASSSQIGTSLIESAFVVIFGIAVIETMGKAIFYYIIRGIKAAEARTLSQLFRVLAYSLLTLTVLTILIGIQNISGLLVGAGFLGVVVGLAAQSTISNLIAGVYLLASRTIEPGDYVNLQTWQYTMQPQTYPHDKFIPGFAGTVESIGVLYTKLIHEDGIPLYIPNSIVSQALVLNYHRAKDHKIKIQFDLNIGVPYKIAEDAIDKVMKKYNIKDFTVGIDYLHTSIYVMSVSFEVVDANIRRLRSAILHEILESISKKRARSRKIG